MADTGGLAIITILNRCGMILKARGVDSPDHAGTRLGAPATALRGPIHNCKANHRMFSRSGRDAWSICGGQKYFTSTCGVAYYEKVQAIFNSMTGGE